MQLLNLTSFHVKLHKSSILVQIDFASLNQSTGVLILVKSPDFGSCTAIDFYIFKHSSVRVVKLFYFVGVSHNVFYATLE